MKKYVILALILISFVSAQECNTSNTPNMILPSKFNLNEEEQFIFDIDISNFNESNVIYSLAAINLSILEFKIEQAGLIKFTPTKFDSGLQTMFIIATTQNGCYDIQKLTLEIYDRPRIIKQFPSTNLVIINETEKLNFTVNATTKLENKKLDYYWYYNDKSVANYSKSYLLKTNYTDSGNHSLKAVVVDSRNLNKTLEWKINVKNKNRGMYLKSPLPSLVVTKDTGVVFNLNDYIVDLDDDVLEFTALFIDEIHQDVLKNQSKIYDILIDDNGDLSISVKGEIYYKQYVKIKATDPEGISIITDSFTIRLATSEDKIEYFKRISQEECEPDVQCGEWSECLPTNIRTRECYDVNQCNVNDETVLESEDCEYGASCSDKIKNQDETGVDCGGSCGPCPTCDDNILNQGETDVDCGGPCKPCPSCYDSEKNQKETDVDCGGSCPPCLSGDVCLIHTDCESQLCIENICTAPTCNDSRKNQGEERVDCGGPCEPCPACNDNILNQGEEKIDCGGPCKPCVSCSDGVKNQGELFTDYCGICDCPIKGFFKNNAKYVFGIAPLFFILVFLFILKQLFMAKTFKSKAKLAKIFSFLPSNFPLTLTQSIINTINGLSSVKQTMYHSDDKNKIITDYSNVTTQFFKQLLETDQDLTSQILKSALKTKTKNPYLIKLFVEFYSYSKDMDPESSFYKIELNEKIDESIKILNLIKDCL